MNLDVFERFAVHFSPGQVVFCEYEPGDKFYLIQKGRVQISRVIGEIEKTIDILQPGEIFGEMAILEEAPRSANAIALDSVKALEFNRANFSMLMEGNPAIALKLLKLFTKRIYDQRRRFMILTLDDIQAKVADVFLMLNESNAAINNDQDEYVQERVFQVTVDDVAHWAGIKVETCRQVLQQFSSQRRVELFKDRIVVKNINDFTRLVSTKRKDS
ncbi:Crp/Fnr family transcriptional regulator [Spirochaeta africana]|uniref:cAMP-binding protein n=1 Tax=Spirochaeta africana (strain ATCC 700263 / DSM 8902 / Z-7692) TaxID=889378 RepID=H9UKB9_SPIAZ|nr:Crp/Fnr family transcriptional regulator [Spirochaeta africana]AFG37962.1 cAMP-binding protein [Spirochaeta africana DSM 8902]